MKTGGVFQTIAPLYVELPDGDRYLLADIPEDKVAKFFKKDTGWPGKYSQGYTNDNDPMASTTLGFRDGKLYSARFDAQSRINLPFSLHKDGPYVKLPITRETMLKVFGEPERWSSYTPVGGA